MTTILVGIGSVPFRMAGEESVKITKSQRLSYGRDDFKENVCILWHTVVHELLRHDGTSLA